VIHIKFVVRPNNNNKRIASVAVIHGSVLVTWTLRKKPSRGRYQPPTADRFG